MEAELQFAALAQKVESERGAQGLREWHETRSGMSGDVYGKPKEGNVRSSVVQLSPRRGQQVLQYIL